MIFWTGKGWLAIAIPMVLGFAELKGGDAMLGPDYMHAHTWPAAAWLLLSAVLVWFIGRSLNDGIPSPSLMDVMNRSDHSFFFIRMEYWAFLIVIAAVAILFAK